MKQPLTAFLPGCYPPPRRFRPPDPTAMTGLRLAQYRIDAELGRGGMGIVYRATDTKLDRTVAVKVLPPHALASADDRARFYREAKAAAQLHHPNIATVFQVDEAEVEGSQRPFIAMEYIDGESLSDRIAKGPLKLEEAISIATQIAEALKAAHAKDIVHRDIKSANVMLTKDGVAKVLDFGLAKTAASTQLTRQGSTMGTVAYMSPEQARGEEVDRRTDLWALGVVLYEMISGRLPFSADYEQAALYGILNEDPEPLTALRTGVPMELERMVSKCLAKNPATRYQSAEGLLSDLHVPDRLASRPPVSPVQAASTGSAPPRWAVVTGIALLSGLIGWFGHLALHTEALRDYPMIRSEVPVGNGERSVTAAALSPDGRLLAYSDHPMGQVWIRRLATGEEIPVPGTRSVTELEFSPDSEWLVFDDFTTIYRVPSSGGTPTLLVSEVPGGPHSTWVTNDEIIFDANEQGILRYDVRSGTVSSVSVPDTSAGHIRYVWADVSDNRRWMAAMVVTGAEADAIGIFSYPDGRLHHVDPWMATAPRFIGENHIAGVQNGKLVVRAFDSSSGRFQGPAAELVGATNVAWDINADGLLIALQGSRDLSLAVITQPTGKSVLMGGSWERFGTNLGAEPQLYYEMAIAPDGRRLALEIAGANPFDDDIWIFDLEDQVFNRLTVDDSGNEPAWLPRGDSIVFVDRTDQRSLLAIAPADGSGQRRVLLETPDDLVHPTVSPDGNTIAYSKRNASTNFDIWFFDRRSGTETLVARGEEDRLHPQFSPDGRYLSYWEWMTRLVVRTTDLDGSEWEIVEGEAAYPRWSPEADYLYFLRQNMVYRVPVDVSAGVRRTGSPELLSQGTTTFSFDVDRTTGELVLAAEPYEGFQGASTGRMLMVTNVLPEIERIAPSH